MAPAVGPSLPKGVYIGVAPNKMKVSMLVVVDVAAEEFGEEAERKQSRLGDGHRQQQQQPEQRKQKEPEDEPKPKKDVCEPVGRLLALDDQSTKKRRVLTRADTAVQAENACKEALGDRPQEEMFDIVIGNTTVYAEAKLAVRKYRQDRRSLANIPKPVVRSWSLLFTSDNCVERLLVVVDAKEQVPVEFERALREAIGHRKQVSKLLQYMENPTKMRTLNQRSAMAL